MKITNDQLKKSIGLQQQKDKEQVFKINSPYIQVELLERKSISGIIIAQDTNSKKGNDVVVKDTYKDCKDYKKGDKIVVEASASFATYQINTTKYLFIDESAIVATY